MTAEPDNLVLHLLREMRGEITQMRGEMTEMRGEITQMRGEITEMRGQMATKADLAGARKEFGEQIVGLRRTVVEYHSVVVGHGSLISELERRLRRVEQHLNLEPSDH